MRHIAILIAATGLIGAAWAQVETPRPPPVTPSMNVPLGVDQRASGAQLRTAQADMQALRTQVRTLARGVRPSTQPALIASDRCRAGNMGWRACVDRIAAAAAELPEGDRESLNREMAALEAEIEANKNAREADTSRFSATDQWTQQQYNTLSEIVRTQYEIRQSRRHMK